MKPFTVLQNQRGMALIAGLLILVVLSVLGLTTMLSSVLQERMAGNQEQRDIAFQAAEAGLRDAENMLENLVVIPIFNNSSGLYRPADSTLWSQGGTWTGTPYVGGGLNGASFRYYLEYMMDVDITGGDSLKFGPAPEDLPGMYRITSRGESPNTRGRAVLQSTYIR